MVRGVKIGVRKNLDIEVARNVIPPVRKDGFDPDFNHSEQAFVI